MKVIKYFAVLCLVAFIAILSSCTKSGDAYKKYMAGGEITYPGRLDTVLVHSGYNRVQLSATLGNDPLVTKMRVFYNNHHDSTEVAITHAPGKDTVNVIIDKLTEGNYSFDVYTYDAQGRKSVGVNVSGVVYGPSYLNSLINRKLKTVEQSPDGNKIELGWGEPANGELGVEINYTAVNGSAKKFIVPANQTNTELPDYKESSVLTFKSLFKPDTTAFETFSPDPSSVTLPKFERQFDKSKFAVKILPTDVLEGGYGWLEEYLWDESYNPPGFATESTIPCWFTFDAGTSTSLSRFKVWQANDRLYQLQSVKTFELYGSNNPNMDGSWASWTKIGSYTSVKPSGLPVGQNSDTDVTFALAGENFSVPASTPKFRYYRFKLLSNYGGDFMTLEEITFYTHER